MVTQEQLTNNGEFFIGVDSSTYNIAEPKTKPANWTAAKLNGVEFGAHRLSVGGYYIDQTFLPNMLAMAEAGLEYRMFYVVLRPDYTLLDHMKLIEQGLGELEREEGSDYVMPLPVLDVEVKAPYVFKNNVWSLRSFPFDPKAVNQLVMQLGKEFAEWYTKAPLHYSNWDYISNFMGTAQQKAYLPGLFGRPWIANYMRSKEASLLNKKPLVPYPYKQEGHEFNGALVHQFTADENDYAKQFGFGSRALDLNRVREAQRQEFHDRFVLPESNPPEPIAVSVARLHSDLRYYTRNATMEQRVGLHGVMNDWARANNLLKQG